MLKKTLLALSLLILASFSINPIFAQTRIDTKIQVSTETDTSSTDRQMILRQKMDRREEVLELRRQKQAEIKNRIELRVATREARLVEARQQRVQRLFNTLSERIISAADRLLILTDRIESRLEEIEKSDPQLDTESILSDLIVAEDLIIEAKTDVESLNSALALVLESDDPKTAFEEIRITIKDAKVKLVEAHRILASVIGDIKGLRVGQTDTSPETNSSGSASEVTE